MEFWDSSTIRLRRIRAGNSLITSFFRKDMEAAKAGIEGHKTDTDWMKISPSALTAIDLVRYPRASGGTDNIATVFLDLGRKIDPGQLASISALV